MQSVQLNRTALLKIRFLIFLMVIALVINIGRDAYRFYGRLIKYHETATLSDLSTDTVIYQHMRTYYKNRVLIVNFVEDVQKNILPEGRIILRGSMKGLRLTSANIDLTADELEQIRAYPHKEIPWAYLKYTAILPPSDTSNSILATPLDDGHILLIPCEYIPERLQSVCLDN